MLKTLVALGLLAFVVWFFFFRKPRSKSSNTQSKIDSMVECKTCKTFVLQNEAILSNGRYYCSQECLMRG